MEGTRLVIDFGPGVYGPLIVFAVVWCLVNINLCVRFKDD